MRKLPEAVKENFEEIFFRRHFIQEKDQRTNDNIQNSDSDQLIIFYYFRSDFFVMWNTPSCCAEGPGRKSFVQTSMDITIASYFEKRVVGH